MSTAAIFNNPDDLSGVRKYLLLHGNYLSVYANDRGDLAAPAPLSGGKPSGQGNAQGQPIPEGSDITDDSFIADDGSVVGPRTYATLFSIDSSAGGLDVGQQVRLKSEYITLYNGTSFVDRYTVKIPGLVAGSGWADVSTLTISAPSLPGDGEPGQEVAETFTRRQSGNKRLDIKHRFILQEDGTGAGMRRLRVEVTVTNNSTDGSTFTGVRYARVIDPNPGPQSIGELTRIIPGSELDTEIFAIRGTNNADPDFEEYREISLGVLRTDPNAQGTLLVMGVGDSEGAAVDPTSLTFLRPYLLLGSGTAATWFPSGDLGGGTPVADYRTLRDGSTVTFADTPAGNPIFLISPELHKTGGDGSTTLSAGESAEFAFYYSFYGSEPAPPAEGTSLCPDISEATADVRLYSSDGKRRDWLTALPGGCATNDPVVGVSFELGERGGMLSGQVDLSGRWEEFDFTGNERVDIRLGDVFAFRGWARGPAKELGNPESCTLQLYGLMEQLNGYLVRRCSCYAEETNVAAIFTELINTYVKVPGRLPDVEVDIADVGDLVPPLKLTEFCAKGKSVTQAFNQLCDTFPNLLIWGADVDGDGNDRLYLRPRATSVGYVASIGDDVSLLSFSQDATKIVNRIFLTGGTLENPNLLTNPSFETCVKPGIDTTNLLLNGGFEENDGDNEATHWTRGNDPTLDTANARSGGWCYYLDDNPDAEEALAQVVPIANVSGLTAAVFYKTLIGGVNEFRLKIRLLDASDAELYSAESDPFDVSGSNANSLYHKAEFEYPGYPSGDTSIAKAEWSIRATLITDDSKGISIDDAALYSHNIGVEGWRIGQSSDGYFSLLEWVNNDATPAPAHGGNKVKVTSVITDTGGYAEISTTEAARPSVKQVTPYVFSAGFQTESGSGFVRLGARLYNGDTLQATLESSDKSVTSGLWQAESFVFTTLVDTTNVEPFIRFMSDGLTFYLDRAGLWVGETVPDEYGTGDALEAERDTDDYDASEIGDAAAASIATWGEREAEVTVDQVLTTAQTDTYAKQYLQAHAVPEVAGRLEIFGVRQFVNLDVQVKVINLLAAPDPLNIAKIRYEWGDALVARLDLNNERPDMAALLLAAAQT